MQTIAQTITQTITETRKGIKEYPVPSFWKSNIHYPRYYALLPDGILTICTTSSGEFPSVGTQAALYEHDRLTDQIQADEFSAVYEAAQIQITDAFQSAFPTVEVLTSHS